MSNDKVKIGFELNGIEIPIENILPIKIISDSVRKSLKYARIETSIKEMGIIDPPVVFPEKREKKKPQQYLLLDGHIRVEILKKLGHKTVYCLVSTEDEPYTYNHKVNRLTSIQEHTMLLKSIEGGVTEEDLAKALDVNIGVIRKKRDMLDGICQEAVELLKDKEIYPESLRLMKKVKPIRQIEMAELMNSIQNYSKTYVKALIVATRKAFFIDEGKTKQMMGITPEALAQMEKEMESVEKDFKLIEESFGRNMMHLMLANGYLDKLLENGRVVRFLASNYNGMLVELQKIIDTTSLET